MPPTSMFLPSAGNAARRGLTMMTASTPPSTGRSRLGLSTAWNYFFRKASFRRNATRIWGATTGSIFARGLVVNAGDSSTAPEAAPATDGPRVCILGGGFGGLYTAVKLENLFWPRGTKPRVTLVDQAERFTFKPLLYELLTGAATADEVSPSYSQLLAPYPVQFVQGRVAAVQPQAQTADGGSEAGGTVVLDSGESLPYDWLVLALGAETNTFGIPGVKEYALAFSTFQDAEKLKSKLDALAASPASSPEVVVVGGGYAGVELAAAVAENLKGTGRIQLVTSTPDILDVAPEGQRDAARRALEDEGVSILTSAAVTDVRLAAATPRSQDDSTAKRLVYVKDEDGQTEILEADVVVWAAGQAPVPRMDAPRLKFPFPCDGRGATQTDSTLKVLRNRRVFALGDVAVATHAEPSSPSSSPLSPSPTYENSTPTPSTQQLPATAQVAFQQADYVAWNIWASINNRPLLRFSYQHLGEMMSLGPSKGAVSLPIPVPPPLSAAAQSGPLGELLRVAGVKVSTTYAGASDGVTVEGPLAALIRRAAYLYRQPTDRQRAKVAASWLGQATTQAAELARQILLAGGGSGK